MNRPQARKNLKAENGKGPNIQTATTSTRYLGCPHREESNSSQHAPKNEDRPTDGEDKGGKLTAEEAKGEKARE